MSDSMLRKGKTLPDGTYEYTCGCGFADPDCLYCQGGDLDLCLIFLKAARGDRYYGLLKTILSHIGKQMKDEVIRIRERDGGLSIPDIGWISLKYQLNFKATCEWLAEVGAIRTMIYEGITPHFTVGMIMQAAALVDVCEQRNQHEWYLHDGEVCCRQCSKKMPAEQGTKQ